MTVVCCPVCGQEADLADVEVTPVTHVARWTCSRCESDVEVELVDDRD